MYWWQYIPDPRLTNIPFWVKLLPWFWLRNEDAPVPPLPLRVHPRAVHLLSWEAGRVVSRVATAQ